MHEGNFSMCWVMGISPGSPSDSQCLLCRCFPAELVVPRRSHYLTDGIMFSELQNKDPALSPTKKHPSILPTFIPWDEQSPPWRRLCFTLPVQLCRSLPHRKSPLCGYFWLAAGPEELAFSQPLQRTPLGITSCVLGSAWVNRLPSASPLPAAKYLPAPLPV